MAEQRLFQKVADKILGMIKSGSYPPGTRLPGERELADRFQVSRLVIREAEISLEALGHVEIRGGSGVYVCEPDPANLGRLPNVTAFELTQARLMFESESAALAARVITDEQIHELEQTIVRMSDATHDMPDGDDADRSFHLLIAKASGNTAIMYIMERLWRMRTELDEVRQVYSGVCVQGSSHRVEEHEAILDALRERNPEKARRAMRIHFSRLIEALLVASEHQAIEEAKHRSSVDRDKYLKTALAG